MAERASGENAGSRWRAAPKDIAPLQVLAEPLGNGLTNVRWNAQSSAIAQARDGRLVITEHDKAPRIMALDAAQLQIGHLTYQSTAESIQFDLEVNDRSGGVAKESILSLSSPAVAAPQTAHEQLPRLNHQVVPQAAAAKVQAAAPAVVQPTVDVRRRLQRKRGPLFRHPRSKEGAERHYRCAARFGERAGGTGGGQSAGSARAGIALRRRPRRSRFGWKAICRRPT